MYGASLNLPDKTSTFPAGWYEEPASLVAGVVSSCIFKSLSLRGVVHRVAVDKRLWKLPLAEITCKGSMFEGSVDHLQFWAPCTFLLHVFLLMCGTAMRW